MNGEKEMEILKFENAPAPRKATRKKSNLKSLAGLATVAAVAVLGSTLAANISLGTGAAIEFGQGVQVTSACDGLIKLAPKANFVNDSVNPQFYLSTVSFSEVDGQSSGCQDKILTLNAYGETSATPVALSSSSNTAYTSATVAIKSSPTTSTAVTVANASGMTTASAAFDLVFSNPQATSGAVYKLTLQSSN